MSTLFVDFETFYDPKTKYSLKNMPALQYVRDKRFKVLGMAVNVNNCDTQWYDNHDDIQAFFDSLKHRGEVVQFVGHNASFDALVAKEVFGYEADFYACTMFMARFLISQGVLPADTGTALKDIAQFVNLEKGNLDESLENGTLQEYCEHDVEICRAFYNKFSSYAPLFERSVMDLHIRISAIPQFNLDVKALKSAAAVDATREALYPKVRQDALLVSALNQLGVDVPQKLTAKGNVKAAFSKTDEFMKELLAHEDPRVRNLAELRLEAYGGNERNKAQRFIDAGSPLVCPLMYYACFTGRSGGRDYNVQNMNRGGNVRKALMAKPGHKLLIIDSGQVEVRVAAWIAQEENLLKVFREGRDVYKDFASRYLFNKPVEEVTKDERQRAKPAVLALGFGQGANGFINYCKGFGIDIDLEESTRVVNIYRKAYPRIIQKWKTLFEDLTVNGYTQLLSDRKLIYPNLHWEGSKLFYDRHGVFLRDTKSKSLFSGLAFENAVQATARDLVFWQVLQVIKKYPEAKPCLLVHDEAVFMVPNHMAEEVLEYAEECFTMAPCWCEGIPVIGDGHLSDRYDK